MSSRIPPEIIEKIFISYLRASATNHVLTLSTVCSRWHNIAALNPHLWTKVVLSRRRHVTDPVTVAAWLTRSGALPVDITIRVPSSVDWESAEEVITVLSNYVHQFSALYIDTDDDTLEVLPSLLHTLAMDDNHSRAAPWLKLLSIRANAYDDGSHLRPPLYALEVGFNPAPLLETLDIPVNPPIPSTSYILPQVKALTLHTPHQRQREGAAIDNALDALMNMPRLVHFRYDGVDRISLEGDIPVQRVVHLPALQTATVTVPGGGAHLLQCLGAPSLAILCLDGRPANDGAGGVEPYEWTQAEGDELAAALACIMERSLGLHRMDLICPGMHLAEYRAILDMFPGLKGRCFIYSA